MPSPLVAVPVARHSTKSVTLLFGHASPDAECFGEPQRVQSAFGSDGAFCADGLGFSLSSLAGSSPFAFWMKEQRRVFAAASGRQSPLPVFGESRRHRRILREDGHGG